VFASVTFSEGMRTIKARLLFCPEILPAVRLAEPNYERAEGQLVPTQTDTSPDFALLMSVDARSAPDLYERVLIDPRFAALTPLVVPVAVSA
jgi:hypothetical protein